MKYILSPEFHRNLWLDFSPVKILAVPLILSLIVTIIVQLGNADTRLLMDVSLWAYFLSVIVWGNYQAANAFGEEIKDKTWDLQKMSSLTPGKLFFGKLFGSTAYVWYAGLPALAVFVYAYGRSPGSFDKDFFYTLLFLVMAGVFGHAVSFLAGCHQALSATKKTMRGRLPGGVVAFVLGFVASYEVYSMIRDPGSLRPMFEKYTFFNWYNLHISGEVFITMSLFFFLGWALIGIYRMAKAELMYRMTPLYWAGFVASVTAYFLGNILSVMSRTAVAGSVPVVFVILTGFTYLTMLSEAGDSQKYRRLLFAFGRKNFRLILENTPKWLATFPLVILAFFIGSFVVALMPGSENRLVKIMAFMTSVLAFAIRDGFVIHATYIGQASGKHIRFQQGLYFVLVYFLLPVLHVSFMGKNLSNLTHAMDLYWYFPLPFGDNPVTNIFPPVAQASAAFLWFRYRQMKQRIEQ